MKACSRTIRHFIRRCSFPLLLCSIIGLPILQGCGTLSNGQKWGFDATLTPGWDRVKTSAVNAALSPETWGPVAGALALQIGNMDRRISDKVSDKTPVFGSQEHAEKWSDYMRDASGAVYFVTVLATPSGDTTSEWLTAKAKGLALGFIASEVAGGGTSLLKRASGRTRPDGSNDASFPSGHASGSAVFTTLARRNLETITMSHGSRIVADIGIAGLAVGTGWARIEAKKHYPSDILVGYALGHFASAFINDAFLGLDNKNAPLVIIEPSRKGMFAGLSWTF
jgi:hypothetical protein